MGLKERSCGRKIECSDSGAVPSLHPTRVAASLSDIEGPPLQLINSPQAFSRQRQLNISPRRPIRQAAWTPTLLSPCTRIASRQLHLRRVRPFSLHLNLFAPPPAGHRRASTTANPLGQMYGRPKSTRYRHVGFIRTYQRGKEGRWPALPTR